MKKGLIILLPALLFLNFGIVHAAPLVTCGNGSNYCNLCDLFQLVNNILKFVMFELVPTLAVIMILVGGVMFLFAGASPSTLQKAKNIIIAVVIGIVIIFMAWIIVNTVLTKIGIVDTSSVLHWYQLDCSVQ